jgi:RNA-directed DNA polymerase
MTPNRLTQKLETVLNVRDAGFLVGEFETPLSQEVFHERLDFILQQKPRCAGDDEVIRIANQVDLAFLASAARLAEAFRQQPLQSIQSSIRQDGECSPALAYRALDGLEALLHERFGNTRQQHQRNKVHLVRYADDFIITGTSAELLRDEGQPLVAHFLSERGLELSHEKTSITHVDDGFDFLGQNVRRYGAKILLKPSRKNVKAFLAKIDAVIQQEGGYLTAGQLIGRLNPKIRGWALYHRHASSAHIFARVDDVIFKKLWRWARRRHRGKSAAWVKRKYFTGRADNPWRFRGIVQDKDGGFHTVFLVRARDTPIRRHVKVRATANPYDPTWELYFEERLAHQSADSLTGQGTARYLWREQNGQCLVCHQPRTLEAGWHAHHLLGRVFGGDDHIDNLVLLHPTCHRRVPSEGLVVEKFVSREGRS